VNSLPKTVTRQRRDYDLDPGPSVPESSTLTTRLPSHPMCTSVHNICDTVTNTQAYIHTVIQTHKQTYSSQCSGVITCKSCLSVGKEVDNRHITQYRIFAKHKQTSAPWRVYRPVWDRPPHRTADPTWFPVPRSRSGFLHLLPLTQGTSETCPSDPGLNQTIQKHYDM